MSDSKTLTDPQREVLFAKIKVLSASSFLDFVTGTSPLQQETAKIGWAVRVLSPCDISTGMLGRHV